MSPVEKYRRLPGRSGLLIRHSLWMQPDHLLRVRANPFSEQYRRYYFADIQSLVLTELPGTAAFYWYAVAISLVLIGAFAVYSRHPDLGIFSEMVSLIPLYVGWRVPNCACYIKTSVSNDKLLAVRKLQAAKKMIAIVIPEIERAQGLVSREALESHGAANAGAGSMLPPPIVTHYGGQLHWYLFGTMVFSAVLAAVTWMLGSLSTPMNIIAGAASAATLLLAILAAFKQHRSDLARSVRWAVISTLVFYPLDVIVTFVYTISVSVQRASRGLKPDAQAVLDDPIFRIIRVTDITLYLVLGCVGLVLLWLHRRATQTPPPLATPEDAG